jgi:hypothetical protein
VQDFAVQVAAGQGAMRAFGQQAPQFLGAFGPAGAIAGAVVAVGALAAQFLLGSQAAKSAAKETDAYTQAVRSLHDAITGARFNNMSPLGKKKDLEAQIADRKNQIRKLFEYTNRFELDQEKQRLGKQRVGLYASQQDAIRRGESPDTNANAIAAIDQRLAEINANNSEDQLKANLTKIAEIGKEMVKLKQDLAGITKDIADEEARAAAARVERLQSQAGQIIKRNQSAVQRFNESMKELREVFFSGQTDLTRTQYEREAARLKDALNSTSARSGASNEPLTDSFRRIGLLSGPDSALRQTDQQAETKKQTGLLEKINQTLERVLQNPRDLPNSQGFWVT